MLDQRTELEAQVAKLQSEVNSVAEAATSGAEAPAAEIESFKVALKVVQEANEQLVADKASLEVEVEQLVASVAAVQLNSDGAASKQHEQRQQRIRVVFEQIDSDRSGYLEKAELLAVHSTDAVGLLERLDVNHDGKACTHCIVVCCEQCVVGRSLWMSGWDCSAA